MPKAKLVTRSASTSSVTTDSIPKNAGLTNAELDSNFLNLRDAGWRLRADDSTQHTITDDTQINFAGGTITTDANGDITVSNLGGGGSVGDLSIAGSTISAPSNGNLKLTTSGDGNVVVQDAMFMVSQPASGSPQNEDQGEIMRIGWDNGVLIDVNHNGNSGGSFNIYGPDGQSSGYDDAPLQISLSGSHVGCIIKLASYNSGALPTGGPGYVIAISNSLGQSNRLAYYDGSAWRFVDNNSIV
jgi:hypothetical protein